MSSHVIDILPTFKPLDSNLYYILSVSKFALFTVSLPFVAFLCCVFLCLLWDFESSTATHCHVPNYLPSISAAIGGFEPQIHIWKYLILLHAIPRFIFGVLYKKHYRLKLGRSSNDKNINIIFWLYVIEISCLIGLSVFSSIENKYIHEKSFIGFVLCSVLHMIFTVCLHKDIISADSIERWSLNLKYYLAVANFSSIAAALYFYCRHNAYCEPLVYTCFAFCEYVFVLTNMAFHLTAYYDFYNYGIIIREAVPNYLPSISAAIGSFEPQRYLWRILIALHATPRFLIGVLYWRYNNVKLGRDSNNKTPINITALLYFIEVACLIGLSYISSFENKKMHEKCFIGFVLCSVLHMILTVNLHNGTKCTDARELWSRKLKCYFSAVNICSIVAAMYFYYRHNAYCEPLVYTCFAFCEYIFVLTNMAFHLTAYYDFNNYSLIIGHEIVQKLR